MIDDLLLHAPLEPERYELAATPEFALEFDRRGFFKRLGAGLLVVCVLRETPAAAQQESGGARRQGGRSVPREISSWLHIGEDGGITVFTGKVEVGQDIRTSLTQAVAEELRVPLGRIKLVMGDTARTPYDQGTFGSQTTPRMNLQLRRVAAAARDRLVNLAAKNWGVEEARLVAVGGKVTDPQTELAADYAELVRGQELADVISSEDALTPAAEWVFAGKPAPKVDGIAFVTGRHLYPSDQKRPGMLYGKVLRPASFGAELVSADVREAEAIPGVAVVREGNFIGVAGPSEDAAERALTAIRAEWKSLPQPSGPELFEYLKKNQDAGRAGGDRGSRNEVGNVDEALAAAAHRLRQTYTVAYIAHAPLEPRAALADWSGDDLTVWTATQRPFGVQSELAQALAIPEERVRVIVPDTGSAYGGKHTGEYAVEAARIARAAKRPVKLVWTREEEFTWAYFRPAGVIEVQTGAASDGTITAWDFHNYNSGASAIRPLYAIPNQRVEFHRTRSPLRQGSYRGLAATANHFARESHIDELAQLVQMDPLEFRLKNLKDERLKAVLQAAANKIGWGKARLTGSQGFGIAGGFEKGGYVATCAEVEVKKATGAVNIVRLVTSFECGAIVNPDGLRNQVEGAVIMGLGGALFEAIEFENGRILNGVFSKYRVPRFRDVPRLETVLLDRKDLPSAGAGETPIVCVAPAIANAIFAASSLRLRSLPLVPNGLKTT